MRGVATRRARAGLAAVFQVFPKRPGNEARVPSDF